MLNRALLLLLVVPLAAASLSGAETPVARHWSAAQFTDIQKKIVASSATGSGIDILMENPQVRAVLLHRQDNSQAEIHERLSEFYIVRSGRGTIVVGGRAVNAKPTDPGELRGDRLEGGERYPMAVGDVLYVAANTPHQVLVNAGESMDTLVMKIADR